MMQGRCEEARAALEAEPIRWVRLTGRTLLLARTGQQQAARGELTAFKRSSAITPLISMLKSRLSLATRTAAMRWLENARRVHDPGLTGQAFSDPLLDPLRGDPRFEKLLRDLGFERKT
jgi:hypothetical protein